MRIVIDIDGTICETKKPGQSYDQLRVNPGAAEKIQQLKAAGHYIILQTARHMKTTGGDVQKVVEKVGDITKQWLKDNRIVYDELHFGKPYNEVLIDDRAFVFEGWDSIQPENFKAEKINVVISSKDLEKSVKKVFGEKSKCIVASSASDSSLRNILPEVADVGNFQQLFIASLHSHFPENILELVSEDNLYGAVINLEEKFVKNDKWGCIEEIMNNSSNAAIYYFRTGRDFLSCGNAALRQGKTSLVAALNELAGRGQKVKAITL